MEVKPGYKYTELGVIPENWNASTIGEVATFSGGSQPPRSTFRFTPASGYIRLIQIRDYKTDAFMTFVPEDLVRKRCSAEDVMIGRYGPPVFQILRGLDGAYNVALIKVNPEHSRVDKDFLYYTLKTDTLFDLIDSLSRRTSGQTGVDMSALKAYGLALPPLPEQRTIATALNNMDALLDGLDRLIDKKRAIKQATMQQLLTGQTRLPGFREKWDVKRLGNHLNFLKNGVNSRAELTYSEGVRYLHYGDIHGSSKVMLNPTSIEMPCLPLAKASHLDRLQDGDLIYADASEDIDGIGKSVEVQNVSGVELVAGLHTIAIRFDKRVLADGFKAYIQFIPEFRTHLRQLAAGTKVYATNRAHIASAELRLPGIDEQLAISALLTDMDTEITALEARRTKTRALKQAMMQELLTGRTRLV